MEKHRIGLIGFGTVGSGVVQGLIENGPVIRRKTGLDIEVKTIADIDTATDRGIDLGSARLTNDYTEILNDAEISLVVQLVGGTEIAFRIMKELLEKGKHVVTANKALLAEKGPELFKTAKENGVSIAFEASCAGGIPIISAMRDGLAGNSIDSFFGIVNGTSNYILSEMSLKDLPYDTALKGAQEKGYAEADPTFDVEGIDAAHKLVLLTAIAFRAEVSMDNIYIEGITNIEKTDISFAKELGYTVKSLAIGRMRDDGLELRVHPTLLPVSHPLSSVNGSFNAVCIDSNLVGETMFYGKGAGSLPTGSAVIADIIETLLGAYDVKFRNLCWFSDNDSVKVIPFSETVSRFYVRFSVKDVPGVIAKITTVLSENNISIASMIQHESRDEKAGIEMMTHECTEKDFQAALATIAKLDFVAGKPSFIRALDMGFDSK